jgi:proteasome accessory factor A
VIFDVPGREALQRVPTMEPLRGTKAHVGRLLADSPTALDLLSRLSRAPRGAAGEGDGDGH